MRLSETLVFNPGFQPHLNPTAQTTSQTTTNPRFPKLTMPWGLWSDTPSKDPNGAAGSAAGPGASSSSSIPSSAYSAQPDAPQQPIPPPAPVVSKKTRPVSWNDSLNATDWAHYAEPRNWVPTAIAVVAA